MNGEVFKGIKQWEFEWQGTKGKLPVFYYDNTSLSAIFTASTAKVKKLLPHPDMHLIEAFPGKCLVAFSAFEYRQSDIDPYNEFSISFLSTFGKPQIPGVTAAWQTIARSFTAYVWQLPVTTEIARIGGVELYGLPKFIADINFDKGQKWTACDLIENGKKILTIKGKTLPTRRGKTVRYRIYSIKDQVPLEANVITDPVEFAQTTDGKAAELELGTDHPVSETLSTIGLSKRPFMFQFSPRNQCILFGARNMIDH